MLILNTLLLTRPPDWTTIARISPPPISLSLSLSLPSPLPFYQIKFLFFFFTIARRLIGASGTTSIFLPRAHLYHFEIDFIEGEGINDVRRGIVLFLYVEWMDYWAEWRNRFSKNRRVAADQRLQFSRSSRCIDPDLYFRFKDALIAIRRARARALDVLIAKERVHTRLPLCALLLLPSLPPWLPCLRPRWFIPWRLSTLALTYPLANEQRLTTSESSDPIDPHTLSLSLSLSPSSSLADRFRSQREFCIARSPPPIVPLFSSSCVYKYVVCL